MRMCETIAVIAYPPILDIFVTLIFVFFSPFGLGGMSKIAALLVSMIFVTFIPVFPVPYYFKKGIVDINVSNRKQRTLFYVIAIVSYFAAALIFMHFNSLVMFYLTFSYALIALAIMMINFSWKISAHSTIAGPITAIAYIFGWQFLILHIFTLTVMLSRLKLRVHTPAQVIAGAAVSAIITFVVFYAFMPF